MRSRISSLERSLAMSSSGSGMSMPRKQGQRTGGAVIRTWTSAAPPMSRSIPTSWRWVVPSHDAVVEDDDPTAARDLGQHVVLEPRPELAQARRRLDEGPADVAIAHEAVGIREACFLGEAGRSGDGRVRDADDDVGVGRTLAREQPAHLPSDRMDAVTVEARVGPLEVDELEGAGRVSRPRCDQRRGQPVGIDDDDLARLDVAVERGADAVEGAGLGGEHPAVAEPADAERTIAHPVASADELGRRRDDERERATPARHDLAQPLEHGVAVRLRDRMREDRGVGAEAGRFLGRRVRLAQLERVDEVAVVGDRDRPDALERRQAVGAVGAEHDRLDVVEVARAARRVAAMPDRQVPALPVEDVVGQDVRHEPHVAMEPEVTIARDRDAGALLAAVLDGEQREVRPVDDLVGASVDADDAAGLADLGAAVDRSSAHRSGRRRSPCAHPAGRGPRRASASPRSHADRASSSGTSSAPIRRRSPPVSPSRAHRHARFVRLSGAGLPVGRRDRDDDP